MNIFKRLLNVLKDPVNFYYKLRYRFLTPFYQDYILPKKVRRIRSKETIKVLFVINELGSWKTENLYNKMLQHPRFKPVLLLVEEKSAPYAFNLFKDYLKKNNYLFFTSENNEKINSLFKSDIIFYQKPYTGIIEDKYFFYYHLDSLFCYVAYCFRNRCNPELRNIQLYDFVWQIYADNNTIIEEFSHILRSKAKNMVNTGLSFMDDLLLPKTSYNDPWKKVDGNCKRIIFAPHHTIFSDLYTYATFFEYCDFMLELVNKYKDSVQWAFKPHPLLKAKLYKVWGAEKTDVYYSKWEKFDNTQIAEGEYMGLFKYSDALIHDCGSFKLEYLYTGNPVLYLSKSDQEFDYPNWQTQESLRLHYRASTKDDIEKFVKNVINGVDSLKQDREGFVKNVLTPPNGKTACQNIINAILGEDEYKDI